MKIVYLISLIIVFAIALISCKKTYRCTNTFKDTTSNPYWSPEYIDLPFKSTDERLEYEKTEKMKCIPL